MQTGPILRRKRLGVMPSVEVAASPGAVLLASVTNPHGLYLRRPLTRLVTRLRKTGRIMNADRVMDNIRNAFERSGMTLNELGEGLGYDGPTAKKRAWFLLYRTSDPRISTVLAVADALGVKISDLVK